MIHGRLRTDPGRHRPPGIRPSLAADAVVVAVQTVDVRTDHLHRPVDVGRSVSATARAVDVAGDRHARPAVVGIAARLLLRPYRGDLGTGAFVTTSRSSFLPVWTPLVSVTS